MAKLIARAGKLKGMTLDELRVRSAQALHAGVERLRLYGRGCEPADGALARWLDPLRIDGGRVEPDAILRRYRSHAVRLVPGLSDPDRTACAVAERWPDAARETVESAERIVAGSFELLGCPVAFDGATPDWTVEPRSGIRAPRIHWSRIAFLDHEVAGDCKLTWELNRHQYLVTLGQAYRFTRDDRYARTFAAHLASWMDENPPGVGINWTSSLELALRAISWLWALRLFHDSECLDGNLFGRVLKFLCLHARHIETHLSTYFSPNTHLTGEALGLLYLGLGLPELRRSTRWRELGSSILRRQLTRQLLADGVYFEQATCYHRYTTDFYLHASLLARAGVLPLAEDVRPALEAMLEYLMHITRPDGTSPLIGDDDGGRLVVLGRRAADDFRDTLAVGAVLLGRGDFALVARDACPELLWLLGPDGLRAFDELRPSPPAEDSRAFRESGYVVMRSSWTTDADWALLRCGPHGALTGAHAHADALALELSVSGRPVLVDPGTYTYDPSAGERDRFRHSAAHNTITVDERSSSVPGSGPFTWESVARSRISSWVTHRDFDLVEADHDGFRGPASPGVHARVFFFLKKCGYSVLLDRVLAAGAHRVALRFHWAADVTVQPAGASGLVIRSGDDADTELLHLAVFREGARLSTEAGWISPAYGVRLAAPASSIVVDDAGIIDVVTVLARPDTVRLAEGSWRGGAHAGVLTLRTPAGADTVVIRNAVDGPAGSAEPHLAEMPDADGVRSDARWTWVRRSGGSVSSFILVGGRSLAVDGLDLIQADTPLEYAVGRFRHGRWDVEARHPNGTRTVVAPEHLIEVHRTCAASAE